MLYSWRYFLRLDKVYWAFTNQYFQKSIYRDMWYCKPSHIHSICFFFASNILIVPEMAPWLVVNIFSKPSNIIIHSEIAPWSVVESFSKHFVASTITELRQIEMATLDVLNPLNAFSIHHPHKPWIGRMRCCKHSGEPTEYLRQRRRFWITCSKSS